MQSTPTNVGGRSQPQLEPSSIDMAELHKNRERRKSRRSNKVGNHAGAASAAALAGEADVWEEEKRELVLKMGNLEHRLLSVEQMLVEEQDERDNAMAELAKERKLRSELEGEIEVITRQLDTVKATNEQLEGQLMDLTRPAATLDPNGKPRRELLAKPKLSEAAQISVERGGNKNESDADETSPPPKTPVHQPIPQCVGVESKGGGGFCTTSDAKTSVRGSKKFMDDSQPTVQLESSEEGNHSQKGNVQMDGSTEDLSSPGSRCPSAKIDKTAEKRKKKKRLKKSAKDHEVDVEGQSEDQGVLMPLMRVVEEKDEQIKLLQSHLATTESRLKAVEAMLIEEQEAKDKLEETASIQEKQSTSRETHLQAEIERLHKIVKDKELQCHQHLEKQTALLSSTAEELEDVQTRHLGEFRQLQGKIDNLQRENQELSEQVASHVKSLSKMKKKLRKLKLDGGTETELHAKDSTTSGQGRDENQDSVLKTLKITESRLLSVEKMLIEEQETKDKMEEDLENFKRRNLLLSEEVKALKQQSCEHEARQACSEAETKKLRDELESRKVTEGEMLAKLEHLKNVENDLARKEEEARQLRGTVEERVASYSQLQSDHFKTLGNVQKLEARLQVLTQEHIHVMEKKAAEIEVLRGQLNQKDRSDSNSELRDLKREHPDLLKKFKANEHRLAAVEKMLVDEQSARDSAENNVRELQGIASQKSALELELQQLYVAHKKALEDLAFAERKVEEAKRSDTNAEGSQVIPLSDEVPAYKAEVARLKQELQDYKIKTADLDKELEAVEKLKKQLKKRERKVAREEKKLDNANNASKTREQGGAEERDGETLFTKLRIAESRLESTEKLLLEEQECRDQAEDERDKESLKCRRLEEELELASRKFEAKAAEALSLQADLRGKIDSLNVTIQVEKKNSEEQHALIATLEARVKTQEDELEGLRAAVNTHIDELERFRMQVKESQAELEATKAQLKECQDKYKELERRAIVEKGESRRREQRRKVLIAKGITENSLNNSIDDTKSDQGSDGRPNDSDSSLDKLTIKDNTSEDMLFKELVNKYEEMVSQKNRIESRLNGVEKLLVEEQKSRDSVEEELGRLQEAYSQKVDELSRERANSQAIQNKIETLVTASRAQITESESVLATSTVEKQKLKEDLVKLGQEREELIQKCELLDSDKQGLQNELKLARRQIRQFTKAKHEQALATETNVSSLITELESLNARYKELSKTKEILEHRLASVEKLLVEEQAARDSAEESLEHERSLRQSVQLEAEVSLEHHDSLMMTYTQEKQKLADEIEKQQEKCNSLEEDLKAQVAEVVMKEGQIAALEKENGEMQERLKSVEFTKENLQFQLASIEHTDNDLKASLKQLEMDLVDTRARAEQSLARWREEERRRKEKEEDNRNLVSELENMRMKYHAMEKHAGSMESEVWEQQRLAVKRLRQQWETEIQREKESFISIRRHLDEYIGMLQEDAVASIKERNEAITKFNKKAEDYFDHVDEAERQIKLLQRNLADKTTECLSMKGRMQDALQECKKMQSKEQRLKDRLEELDASLSAAQNSGPCKACSEEAKRKAVEAVDCVQILKNAENSGYAAVLQAMKDFPYSASLQHKSMKYLIKIVSKTDAGREEVGAEGGADLAVDAINRFAEHRQLQLTAVSFLGLLAFNNEYNRLRIVAAGAVHSIVKSMRTFEMDPDMQKRAMATLTNIANNNELNRVKISESGGIEAILQAMQDFRDDAELQRRGCGAILTISSSGALGAVLAAMLNCVDSAEVQAYGAWALCNLIAEGDDIRQFARQEGAAEVCEAAAAYFPDDVLVQEKTQTVLAMLREF